MIAYEDILTWIRTFAETVAANRTYLTELDSAIGDADHGFNMDRGMQAVVGKIDGIETRDIGGCLKTAGSTLVSTVGGASGPLYGMFFMQMGGATAGKETLSLGEFATAFAAGIGGVERIGKASPGDKTMLEALLPAAGRGRRRRRRRPRPSARRGRGGGGDARDDTARRPQGPSKLPGRAERGSPGPGRHVVLLPRQVGRDGVVGALVSTPSSPSRVETHRI
jgi:dihydroxyacetone kinase phosphoprotein-dependent L subunit